MTRASLDPPARTESELTAVVARYQRHRAAHPLPLGWGVKDGGLAAAVALCVRGHDPDPMLVFSVPRPGGGLRVIADFYYAGQVTTAWSDEGGGLSPREVGDLLYELVGLRVRPEVVAEVLRGAGEGGTGTPLEFDLVVPD